MFNEKINQCEMYVKTTHYLIRTLIFLYDLGTVLFHMDVTRQDLDILAFFQTSEFCKIQQLIELKLGSSLY